MRALVVYESMFGNCRAIAEAIAAGMADSGAMTVVSEVAEAPAAIPAGLDLLVVGGPNHFMALPTPDSRGDAQRLSPHEIISSRDGLREWLVTLESNAGQTRMAIFDCRLNHPDYVNSTEDASLEIKVALYEKGYEDAAPPLHILVEDKPGPLLAGEADRARRWGAALAGEPHPYRL